MKTLSILILTTLLLFGCNQNKTAITSQKEYESYLENKDEKSRDFVLGEINFWKKKYEKSPNQITYLNKIGSNYTALFELTRDIKCLLKAEKLLLQSNETYHYSEVGNIRALARNYITQHRFKEAYDLANKALSIGEGFKETQKLLFDVNMELGNYAQAEENLNEIKDKSDFDYLIRVSKWNDHNGDLKTAIILMEKAKNLAIENQNKYLQEWTFSNLGDYYGHDGNIAKSYEYYLKTLKLEPNHYHALKGIAWIVFSSERNTKEATRIIDKISEKYKTPDLFLFKAEIAEFDKDTISKNKNLDAYFKMINSDKFGMMYNSYSALIFADAKNTAEKTIEIGKIEVSQRPTPESYDLLAWGYLKLGDNNKALEIAQKHLAGKSFEPQLNFHLATIYKANNKTAEIVAIKKDLQNSIYELGPNFEQKINNL